MCVNLAKYVNVMVQDTNSQLLQNKNVKTKVLMIQFIGNYPTNRNLFPYSFIFNRIAIFL